MSIELEDVFERLRNAKYAFKRAFFSAKMYSLKQYCEIIGADVPTKMQSDLPIAFAGCFNDFFNTYGKNSLYFLFEKDPDWFAKKACRHGAVAIVTQRQISNLPCILVEDACQSFTLNHLDKQYRIRLNCVGQHNIYNAMMSFAAGKETGVPTRKIIKGLSRYRSKSIRQHIYRVSEKTYYMDCCNASARSIDAALHVTDSIQPKKSGRRIAVLGDIDAIESYEEEIYSAIGKSITESKTDIVITYGRFSNLISRHIDTQRIKHLHFSEKPKLVEYLKANLRYGDVVLIKGSGTAALGTVFKKLCPITYAMGELPDKVRHGIWRLKTL